MTFIYLLFIVLMITDGVVTFCFTIKRKSVASAVVSMTERLIYLFVLLLAPVFSGIIIVGFVDSIFCIVRLVYFYNHEICSLDR